MLEKFREQKRAAFIPFIVAGHPNLELSERVVDVLVEEGADLLELGVPYSDAMADGPVIQAASEAAAKHIDSMAQILDFAKKIHKKHPALPMILFTYFNPILRFGLETFSKTAKSAGVAAVLVVDLPPEEAGPYIKNLKEQGLKSIFLASPTSLPERIGLAAEFSTGFLYYVSRTGVTGVQSEVSTSLASELERVRGITPTPIAVGFGISNGAQAAQVAKIADAVVVGSAFVRLISEGQQEDIILKNVRALAREISLAVREARNSNFSGDIAKLTAKLST